MEATATEAATPIVGIDVSKDRLDVHVLGRAGEERFDVARDAEGVAALAARLAALAPRAIGLEATGDLDLGVIDRKTGKLHRFAAPRPGRGGGRPEQTEETVTHVAGP